MAYGQGYVGDPRGRESAVEDAEAYEGQPDDLAALGAAFEGINQGQIGLPPIEQPTTDQPLNNQKENNKLSFYLEDGNFGAVFSDPSSPYAANFNINEQGQVNWGGSVTGETGPFNAKVGLLGQATQFSPYANLGFNPAEGLNFNLHGQSYPGGYSALNPSASYMNQFDTPWGSVNYNIGRQGGRTVGGFNVRGDF